MSAPGTHHFSASICRRVSPCQLIRLNTTNDNTDPPTGRAHDPKVIDTPIITRSRCMVAANPKTQLETSRYLPESMIFLRYGQGILTLWSKDISRLSRNAPKTKSLDSKEIPFRIALPEQRLLAGNLRLGIVEVLAVEKFYQPLFGAKGSAVGNRLSRYFLDRASGTPAPMGGFRMASHAPPDNHCRSCSRFSDYGNPCLGAATNPH